MFKEVGKGSKVSGDTYVPIPGPPESRMSRPLFISEVLSVFTQETKRPFDFPPLGERRTTFQERR